MEIVIIPGFTGHPKELVFQELGETLIGLGHSVRKIAWPHFPHELDKYSFTATIAHVRSILKGNYSLPSQGTQITPAKRPF